MIRCLMYLAIVVPFGMGFRSVLHISPRNTLLSAKIAAGEKAKAGSRKTAGSGTDKAMNVGLEYTSSGAGVKLKSTPKRGAVRKERKGPKAAQSVAETASDLLLTLTRSRSKHEVHKLISRLQSREFSADGPTLDPTGLAVCLAACREFGDWRRSQALINSFRVHTGNMPDATCVDTALGACGGGGASAMEGLAFLRALSTAPLSSSLPLETAAATIVPIGLLGWVGLFEAVGRIGDARAAAEVFAFLESQLGAAVPGDSFSLIEFLAAEPLLLGAASSAFQKCKVPLPQALARAKMEGGGANHGDAPYWKSTLKCLKSLQRRRSVPAFATTPIPSSPLEQQQQQQPEEEEEEGEAGAAEAVLTMDLHGAEVAVAGAAVRAVFRDVRRARRFAGYTSVLGTTHHSSPSVSISPSFPSARLSPALAFVTGRGIHSPLAGVSVVHAVVLEALKTEGAPPVVTSEDSAVWTNDRNPGVLFVPSGVMGKAAGLF
jgi:hypothetical protein